MIKGTKGSALWGKGGSLFSRTATVAAIAMLAVPGSALASSKTKTPSSSEPVTAVSEPTTSSLGWIANWVLFF